MTAISAQERTLRARAAQPAWAALLPGTRSALLARLRRQIALARDSVVQAVVDDTGKPPLDALSGDVLLTLEQMLYYERHAARLLAPQRVSSHPLFFFGAQFCEQLEPCGVVLIYSPSNYPFQLAMVPAATALYAGNAVIVKVSERAPRVAQMVAQLALDAALPDGLMQVVCDDAAGAAAYIDAAPDLVFFTGSSANGAAVAARAAASLIPTVLELGGKDAALVFADCALDRTVEGVTFGAFANAGQVCVGIKRLYIEQAICAQFTDRLARRVVDLRIGSGLDSDLGKLQGEFLRERFKSQVADALARGATLHHPPSRESFDEAPVILSNLAPGSRLLTEESFGPVVCVQSFSTEAEAVTLANASEFALSASIWTRDLQRARRIAARLHAGSCAVNDVIRNIANPHAAFGGNAQSGYGRYHGPEGLRAFSRIKSVMTMRGTRSREIHWFPFSRKTYNALQVLIELRHRPRGLWAAIRRLLQLR